MCDAQNLYDKSDLFDLYLYKVTYKADGSLHTNYLWASDIDDAAQYFSGDLAEDIVAVERLANILDISGTANAMSIGSSIMENIFPHYLEGTD